MKQVSLQELKRNLSKLVEAAASGERIIITRYRRPVAELTPSEGQMLEVGSRFGNAQLRPLFKNKTDGLYLRFLEEDRRGSDEDR